MAAIADHILQLRGHHFLPSRGLGIEDLVEGQSQVWEGAGENTIVIL